MQIQTRAGRELQVCLPLLSENELSLKESVRFLPTAALWMYTLSVGGKISSRLTVQGNDGWDLKEVVLMLTVSVLWMMWMGSLKAPGKFRAIYVEQINAERSRCDEEEQV